MFDFPSCKGRVTGRSYVDFPEGHRTTLVAGLADMLNYALLFASDERRDRLKVLLEFSNACEPSDLRQMLDQYLEVNGDRLKFLVAGLFVAAIDEKC